MDSKETVNKFNDTLMYLVNYFDDRPFQKGDNKLISKVLYKINQTLGNRLNRYNSELLIPDLRFSEIKKKAGRQSVIYFCPRKSSMNDKRPSGVNISYYPVGYPGSGNDKPKINVRTYNPEEAYGVAELLKFLGLKPRIFDNDPYSKMDVCADLCD